MKKLFILSCFFCLSQFIHAQWKVEGFYINNKDDSVRCTFFFRRGLLNLKPNFIQEQYKIEIRTHENEKLTLLPDTVKAIVIKDKELRKFVSRKNDFGLPGPKNKFVFVEILIDDFIKLYRGYYKSVVFGPIPIGGIFITSYSDSKRYIQRGNDPIQELNSVKWNFRNQMCKLFYDNPELVSKIKNKQYKSNDLIFLINDYNNWRKNQ